MQCVLRCVKTDSSTPLVAVTGGLLLGGSTTFLLNLGRAFRERALTLPVFCMAGRNEMAADFAQAGVDMHDAPDTRAIFEDRLQVVYQGIAAKRPRAVLACLGGDSFEMLRMLPKNVLRMGIIQSDDPLPYKLVRQFAPWLDAVVGVSENICRKLNEEPFAGRMRIEYIPYGIHFAPARPVPMRDSSKPIRILYIGRIIETQKRVSRLVELIKLLAARGEKFEFTFAGSGPEMQATQEALRQFSNVRFLGDVPNNEIGKLLRASDIFVLLSDFEGLPLSLLEAMGEGLVPVVSDLESGMRQVVTPETGVLIPIGNVTAAADAICDLARNPAKQVALGTAASELVRRKFSSVLMAERYLKLVDGLSKEEATWPAKAFVPVPVSYGSRWYLQSWARPVRRLLKRVK